MIRTKQHKDAVSISSSGLSLTLPSREGTENAKVSLSLPQSGEVWRGPGVEWALSSPSGGVEGAMTLISRLHSTGCSCVIRKGEEVRDFHQRGVADLWQLCQSGEEFLKGAQIADKVVGKGAAALMVYGGVAEVYADLISLPALELLEAHGVKVTCAATVERIMNRRHDGLCPVESLCTGLHSVEEMYVEIGKFIAQLSQVETCEEVIGVKGVIGSSSLRS